MSNFAKKRRPVWMPFCARTSDYVGRCSKCGRYEHKKRPLYVHWFFNGVYCVSCIQDRLYDNARTMEEMI